MKSTTFFGNHFTMSVRPHPIKGDGWWIIDYYPQGRKGKRDRLPIKGTKAQALAMEADLRRSTKVGMPRVFPRIAEVVPEFITHYRLDHQPAGVARTMYSLQQLIPFFGRYQFTQVVPSLIEQYKTMRLATVTPSTINKELAALSSLCKWAAEPERGYCEPIIVKRFPQKLVKAPLPNVLSRDEVQALLENIPPDKRGVVAAMYYAGLRSSEARYLRRADLWLEKKIMIIRGKGNKQRIVPILSELLPHLQRGREEGYLWVNPATGEPWQDIRGTLTAAGRRAGIAKRITPHLLRHCFGTHSTESGIGLRTLQEVMGHSTSQVTELYTTLAAEHLTADMSKFSDYSSLKKGIKRDVKTKT